MLEGDNCHTPGDVDRTVEPIGIEGAAGRRRCAVDEGQGDEREDALDQQDGADQPEVAPEDAYRGRLHAPPRVPLIAG